MKSSKLIFILLISFMAVACPMWADTIRVAPDCTIERIESSKVPKYVEAIDLGLSVLWANVNIGATSPEQAGDFFAWGETQPKKSFSSSNYTYTDRPTVLPLSADAAHQNWGGKWRMPTKEEMIELRDKCSWNYYYSYKNKYCAQITRNGNTIYLPLNGFYDTSLHNENYMLWLWTSTKYNSESAWRINIYTGSADGNYTMQFFYGMPIRPVCDASSTTSTSDKTYNLRVYASACCSNYTDYTYSAGDSIVIQALANEQYRFLHWSDGNTSNPRTIHITQDSVIRAIFESLSVHTYFSVGETKAIAFSKGNLQYNTLTGKLSFAAHQYDYLGTENQYASYYGPIDLFAWGTGDDPRISGGNSYFYDWGQNTIGDNEPNTWRTMTEDERYYLFFQRHMADSLFGYGTIGSTSGMILLPDNWICPQGLNFVPGPKNCPNQYTTDQWLIMEEAGAIFLPCSGYASSSNVYDDGIEGFYWTASKTSGMAHRLNVKCGIGISSSYSDPGLGHAVRLIRDVPVNKLDLKSTTGGSVYGPNLLPPCTQTTITAVPEECYFFQCWSDGSTENPRSVVVTQDSTFTAIFHGAQTGASITDDHTRNGEKVDLRPATGTENGYTWVNLGFDVMWATCNVGATTPEGYGNYYAWGETNPKSYYSLGTYKYCNGSETSMTKYCTNSSYGVVDNKTTLDSSDDAAHVNMGGNWRMPTYNELNELIYSCTMEWTTQGGVNGYKVNGEKPGCTDQSIFLPAAGVKSGSTLYYGGTYGFLWPSSLNSYYPNKVLLMFFSSGYYSPGNYDRFYGIPVRAVYVPESKKCTLTLKADGCKTSNTYICSAGQQICIEAQVVSPDRPFIRWSDGNTDNPRIITINSDTTLIAEFVRPPYTISTSTVHGTVLGGGIYKFYDNATLTVVPDAHYHFEKWSDGDMTNPRTIFVTQDSTFMAEIALTQHTITTTSLEGTATGDGIYTDGDTATLTATPYDCYDFTQWNDGNTDNPRQVIVTHDSTFVAIFDKKIHSIQLESNNDVYGWVDGNVISTSGFFFEALEDSATVSMAGAPNLLYSINEGNSYQDWDGSKITLATAGDRVYFKANSVGNKTIANTFSTTKKLNVSGNIMYLLNGETPTTTMTEENAECFAMLFMSTTIVDASRLILPAQTLADRCYYGMFWWCPNLTKAPELPAKTLASQCYAAMFYGCENLVKTPALPADTIASYCYYGMFNGCSSITEPPILPAQTMEEGCYTGMFQECTSLVSAPELPSLILANECYNSMFRGCSSLVMAPKLEATILADNCYNSMFYGCSNLTVAPILRAKEWKYRCYYNMFHDCIVLSDLTLLLTSLPSNQYTELGYSWIPYSYDGSKKRTLRVDPLMVSKMSSISNGWTIVSYEE